MKPLFFFIAATITLAALAIAYPFRLFNPGPLMKGHQAIERECLTCHTPFSGASPLQCIDCHRQNAIGVSTVNGTALPKKASRVLFHRGVAPNSCIGCHTDHKGREGAKAVKPFRHEALGQSLRSGCLTCHSMQVPSDALHRSAMGSCSGCHSTDRWKPATFLHSRLAAASAKGCINCHKSKRPSDETHRLSGNECATCHSTVRWKPAAFLHSRLAAASAKGCINCHKSKRPSDGIHRLSGSECATCHATTRWKPAAFDHNRYFRLDRNHRASCSTCHTDGSNYKKYTCYNCHEHSASSIAEEHREEGIYNYQNCVKCHRDGGEGKGERDGSEERMGERGYGREEDN